MAHIPVIARRPELRAGRRILIRVEPERYTLGTSSVSIEVEVRQRMFLRDYLFSNTLSRVTSKGGLYSIAQ